MPKVKLTKSKIDSIKFTDKGQVIYWDTESRGLGLVVGMATKTFRLQIDIKDATKKSGYRTIKKTLGRYGDITLEQAKAMLTGYIDKETGEAVQGERLKLMAGEAAAATGEDVTLKELMTMYFTETKRRDGKARKEGSVALIQKLIERHYEGWMSLTLKEVDRLSADIVLTRYRQIEESGAMNARNSAVTLSAVLNFGKAKYPKALHENPLAILRSKSINAIPKIKARDERLVYDAGKRRNDFKVFYDALQNMTATRRNLHLIVLYTGLRKQEASPLRWDQVDLVHAEIKIEDTKNRQSLHAPLNRQALAILKEQRKIVDDGEVFVFPAVRNSPADKTGHACLRSDNLKKLTGLVITIHGLRRSFITTGRQLKRFEDTRRLVNHVDSSVDGKHYDGTGVEDLRETCQMIGDTIKRYMLESTSTVIQFPGMSEAA